MKRSDFIKSLLGISLASNIPTHGWELSSFLANQFESKSKGIRGSLLQFTESPIPKVRVAFIGMGNRGNTLLAMCGYMIENDQMEVVGISDLDEKKAQEGIERYKQWKDVEPKAYCQNNDAWKEMIREQTPDLVIICTPWELHAEMCIHSMESGSHVACEVPIVCTLSEAWQVVQTAEKTKKHCMMLENCCYNDEELFVLNLVENSVFGELTHAEGAYLHDLRAHMLSSTYYQDRWRLHHHVDRTGNLYTTHGLGPIAMYLGIGRGDYLDHLTSMSSKEHNLSRSAGDLEELPKTYLCGDMNTTLIKTNKGRTIMLQFDTHTGQPYSRINKLSGQKATHVGYPGRLYLDSGNLEFYGHRWIEQEEYNTWRKEHRHPVMRKLLALSKKYKEGHGGMDFVMMYRLIRCLNLGRSLDFTVYDGVLWSAVTPLSEISVLSNSASIQIPDFTGGNWREKQEKKWLQLLPE